MKKIILKSAWIVAVAPAGTAQAVNTTSSYIIGALIALLIMGYLIYTLIRPDKF